MTCWNFSAGPAVLPKAVMREVQEELLSYKGSEMSVMELSHRSSLFQQIISDAETTLRELMDIPDNYHVLFLQGGASLQFAAVPINLLEDKKAGYIISGSWGQKAYEEAHKLFPERAVIIADAKDNHYTQIPDVKIEDSSEFDYIHITTNNTIEGTAYQNIPKYGDIPLVADMSSNILSANYDVRDFGLIYAGAQKNIGPAGLTLVIVREDLIKEHTATIPTMLDYKTHIKNDSMYNTPPTFAIYVSKLVFEWLRDFGGIDSMVALNERKAGLLYKTIEESNLFKSPVHLDYRSLTNIPFITGDKEVDKKFITEATAAGFVNLKGHRSVGGMRASLYNAFPIEGVEALVTFMKEFEQREELEK
ncbi:MULTISPECIES: 3-phosphoserine/phosphohydroxythreonine transaminase [unclassified Jeotgalibaca]|uniref:3-phosphoserine/phosphohydroxythreonine transaminase n=1 Tax=unclassified Jeotgalibaca TaxID=2621505 RepID=UPI003FD013C0